MRAASFRQNDALWLKHSNERLCVFCFLLENRIFKCFFKAVFKRKWHQFIVSFIITADTFQRNKTALFFYFEFLPIFLCYSWCTNILINLNVCFEKYYVSLNRRKCTWLVRL